LKKIQFYACLKFIKYKISIKVETARSTDHTARSVIGCWHDNVLSVRPSVCDAVHCGLTTHPTAKVSEQVNRKCRLEHNFTILNFNSYTDSARPKTMPRYDHTEVMHQNQSASKAVFRLKL